MGNRIGVRCSECKERSWVEASSEPVEPPLKVEAKRGKCGHCGADLDLSELLVLPDKKKFPPIA